MDWQQKTITESGKHISIPLFAAHIHIYSLFSLGSLRSIKSSAGIL